MTNKILYFPYIDIPDNSWTVKSIMYWDEVATITPQSLIETPDELSNFMREVLEANLVQQIFPYSIESHKVDFDKFIAILQKAKINLDEKRMNFKNQIGIVRIHREKFNWKIFDYLESEGLAINPSDFYHWYLVEKSIANLMMLYLATQLSKDKGYVPSTDKQENIPIKFTDHNLNIKTEKIRSQILENILPYPVNPNYSQIAKLKENYFKELKTFRHTIETLVYSLASEQDDRIRQQRLESEIHLINIESERLVEILKENKFTKILKGSIWGIGVDSFATMVAGELVTFGAGTAISLAKSIVDNFKSKPIKNENLSYLALLNHNIK